MKLESEDRVTGLDPVFGQMGIEAGKAIWEDPALSPREKAVLLIAADICARRRRVSGIAGNRPPTVCEHRAGRSAIMAS